MTAQRFILVDAQNNQRAALGFNAIGEPGLTLTDSEGRQRALFIVTKSGNSGLFLYDQKGFSRGHFMMRDDGGRSALGITDAKGRVLAGLTETEDGCPWIVLSDEADEPSLTLGVDGSLPYVELRQFTLGELRHSWKVTATGATGV